MALKNKKIALLCMSILTLSYMNDSAQSMRMTPSSDGYQYNSYYNKKVFDYNTNDNMLFSNSDQGIDFNSIFDLLNIKNDDNAKRVPQDLDDSFNLTNIADTENDNDYYNSAFIRELIDVVQKLDDNDKETFIEHVQEIIGKYKSDINLKELLADDLKSDDNMMFMHDQNKRFYGPNIPSFTSKLIMGFIKDDNKISANGMLQLLQQMNKKGNNNYITQFILKLLLLNMDTSSKWNLYNEYYKQLRNFNYISELDKSEKHINMLNTIGNMIYNTAKILSYDVQHNTDKVGLKNIIVLELIRLRCAAYKYTNDKELYNNYSSIKAYNNIEDQVINDNIATYIYNNFKDVQVSNNLLRDIHASILLAIYNNANDDNSTQEDQYMQLNNYDFGGSDNNEVSIKEKIKQLLFDGSNINIFDKIENEICVSNARLTGRHNFNLLYKFNPKIGAKKRMITGYKVDVVLNNLNSKLRDQDPLANSDQYSNLKNLIHKNSSVFDIVKLRTVSENAENWNQIKNIIREKTRESASKTSTNVLRLTSNSDIPTLQSLLTQLQNRNDMFVKIDNKLVESLRDECSWLNTTKFALLNAIYNLPINKNAGQYSVFGISEMSSILSSVYASKFGSDTDFENSVFKYMTSAELKSLFVSLMQYELREYTIGRNIDGDIINLTYAKLLQSTILRSKNHFNVNYLLEYVYNNLDKKEKEALSNSIGSACTSISKLIRALANKFSIKNFEKSFKDFVSLYTECNDLGKLIKDVQQEAPESNIAQIIKVNGLVECVKKYGSNFVKEVTLNHLLSAAYGNKQQLAINDGFGTMKMSDICYSMFRLNKVDSNYLSSIITQQLRNDPILKDIAMNKENYAKFKKIVETITLPKSYSAILSKSSEIMDIITAVNEACDSARMQAFKISNHSSAIVKNIKAFLQENNINNDILISTENDGLKMYFFLRYVSELAKSNRKLSMIDYWKFNIKYLLIEAVYDTCGTEDVDLSKKKELVNSIKTKMLENFKICDKHNQDTISLSDVLCNINKDNVMQNDDSVLDLINNTFATQKYLDKDNNTIFDLSYEEDFEPVIQKEENKMDQLKEEDKTNQFETDNMKIDRKDEEVDNNNTKVKKEIKKIEKKGPKTKKTKDKEIRVIDKKIREENENIKNSNPRKKPIESKKNKEYKEKKHNDSTDLNINEILNETKSKNHINKFSDFI